MLIKSTFSGSLELPLYTGLTEFVNGVLNTLCPKQTSKFCYVFKPNIPEMSK